MSDVPAGWTETNLGEVVELKRGYDLPERLREEGEVPIISSSGFSGTHNETKVADALAIEQYEQFKAEQRRIEATEPTSDFDKFVDDIGKLNPPDESEDGNG